MINQPNLSVKPGEAQTASPGAGGYYLIVGTTKGGHDVANSGPLAPTTTSYQVNALPTGRTLYARIYTRAIGSSVVYQDVAFTATLA